MTDGPTAPEPEEEQTSTRQLLVEPEVVGPGTEITLTLIDTDLNENTNAVDDTAADTVELSSSDGDDADIAFVETGPNTGIFEATIEFEPRDADADGTATAGAGTDHVTYTVLPGDVIAFRYEDEATGGGSSTIVSLVIEIVSMDPTMSTAQETVQVGGTIALTIEDPDANRDADSLDSVDVDITSDSDPVGFSLSALETGVNTGIFTVNVPTSATLTSGAVTVSTGDHVFLEYTDEFPADYADRVETVLDPSKDFVLIAPVESPDVQEEIPSLFGDTIEGSYVDNSIGLSIEFPDGWSGVSVLNTFPMVAPGGIDFTSEQPATIVLIALDRPSVDDLQINPDAFVSPGEEEDTDAQTCDDISVSLTRINGISAMQGVQECEDAEEGYNKSKTAAFMTTSHFVVVGFSANSEENYDRYVANFDSSLQTLELSGAVDFESGIAEMLNLQTKTHTVMALDNPVDVSIQSNSQISDVQFNEEEKRLSFQVEGEDGTSGTTMIAIDSVLERPYAVTIDGEVALDVSEIVNENTGRTLLRISYDHSVHEVSITGTNVVPEFGVIATLVLALSLIAVIGSMRFKDWTGFKMRN